MKQSLCLGIIAIMMFFTLNSCKKVESKEEIEDELTIMITEQAKTEENNTEKKELTLVQQQAANYLADFPGKNAIKWADVLTQIEGGENPYIISLQTEEKYNEGHVNATYLATFGLDLYEKLFYFPIDKPVYVCSQTGQDAGQAIVLLNMLGFDAIKINGGYNSLKNTEGYEAYVTNEPRVIEAEKNTYEAEVLDYVKQYLTDVSDGKKNRINATKLSELILGNEVQVVDVRAKDTFKEGHIKDAINLPFNKDLGPKLDKLANKRIVVICQNGQNSAQVVTYLKAMGRNNTVMLKGGINAWKNAELPIVK